MKWYNDYSVKIAFKQILNTRIRFDPIPADLNKKQA